MMKTLILKAERSLFANVILPVPLALGLITGLQKLINLIGGII